MKRVMALICTVCVLVSSLVASQQATRVISLTLQPPQNVTVNGLVATYSFSETSGTVALDSSGNNNNAILANGAAFALGYDGNAVQFAQSADPVDVVTIPASSTVNSITKDMTVAMWVYRTGNGNDPAGTGILFCRQIGTGYGEPFVMFYNTGAGAAAGMHFLVNSQGLGYSQEGTAPAVPLNEWHHWVGTYDGSQVKLYKDGVLVWSVNHAGGNLATELNNPISIGAGFNSSTATPNESFMGKVDDVQVYNRALTSSEAQSLYSETAPPPAIQHAATLSWSYGTAGMGFMVYRSETPGGPYSHVGTTSIDARTWTDTLVTSGTTYYYVVTTYDQTQGLESLYSNEAVAVIPYP